MDRDKAYELLDQYFDVRNTWLDYLYRVDYVEWTQENEITAYEKYWEIREKIVDLLCGSQTATVAD